MPRSGRSWAACDCCRGQPERCRNSDACVTLGGCYCRAYDEVGEFVQAEGAARSAPRPSEPAVCECCGGDFYACKSPICCNLEMCQCQLREIIEENLAHPEEEFFPSMESCLCCQGFCYQCACVVEKCMLQCLCLLDDFADGR